MSKPYKQLVDNSKNSDGWTKEACDLDKEIINALTPIIRKYFDQGYSWGDISGIAMFSVLDVILNEKLLWRKP